MSFDVKNTTVRWLSELLCPHYCLMCGKLGGILCEECKNYNTQDHVNQCLKCGLIIRDQCRACDVPYTKSWMVGYRRDKLGKMIDKFKYESVRALGWSLAEMLDAVLPCLPENTQIVPLPTIVRHVRQRGLDHTWLLAKRLAKLRGWKCKKIVQRIGDSVQVGASATLRRKQAKMAYELVDDIDLGANYLVVDDICTTGASIEAVCMLLRQAGVKNVMVAVVAKSG